MLVLSIPDMTSGHCKASVESAIHALDTQADVSVDLGSKEVSIVSGAPIEAVLVALEELGYSAAEVEAA